MKKGQNGNKCEKLNTQVKGVSMVLCTFTVNVAFDVIKLIVICITSMLLL
jgi:hypothetical protein